MGYFQVLVNELRGSFATLSCRFLGAPDPRFCRNRRPTWGHARSAVCCKFIDLSASSRRFGEKRYCCLGTVEVPRTFSRRMLSLQARPPCLPTQNVWPLCLCVRGYPCESCWTFASEARAMASSNRRSRVLLCVWFSRSPQRRCEMRTLTWAVFRPSCRSARCWVRELGCPWGRARDCRPNLTPRVRLAGQVLRVLARSFSAQSGCIIGRAISAKRVARGGGA